jgi:glucoamylase
VQANIFHSDHLELSDQFDARTSLVNSVSDLSWSYASFLPGGPGQVMPGEG